MRELIFAFLFNRLFLVACFSFCIHNFHAQNFSKELDKLQKKYESGLATSEGDYLKILSKYSKEFDKMPDEATQFYFLYGHFLYINKKQENPYQQYNKAYEYSLKARDTTLKYLVILNYARISSKIGNYQKAEEYYRYALPGMAAIYGQSSINYVEIFFEYIRVLQYQLRYNEAKPLLESLEYYFQTLNLLTHPLYYAVLGTKAYIMQEEGDYREAIDIYKFLLSDDKLLKNGDTLEHIVVASNIGEAYREAGEYETALDYQLASKKMMKEFKITDAEQLATTENNLGLIYKSLNDYKNAEECFDNALFIYKKNGLSLSEAYCTSLSNKADLLRLLSRRDEALKLLAEALRIRKSNYGTDSENYANALSNYGLILYEEGITEDAMAYFQEALKIYESTVSKQHQSYANALNNVSSCYASMNQYEKALSYKEEAISIIEKNLGKNHFRYISYLISSWEIYLNNNKFEKGLMLLDEAKQLAYEKFGKNHYLYQKACSNMAILCFYQKNYRKGLDLFAEVLDLKLNNIDTYFYTMNRSNQLAYLEDLSAELFYFTSALMNYAEKNLQTNIDVYVEKLLNAQLLIKSLINKSASRWMKQLAKSEDAAVKSEFQKWIRLRNAMNELYKMDFSKEDEEKLLEEINALETHLRKKVGAPEEKKISHKEIIQNLKQDELAVEILPYYTIHQNNKEQKKYVAICVGGSFSKPTIVFMNNNDFDEEVAFQTYKKNMESQQTDFVSYKNFMSLLYPKVKNFKRCYVSSQGVYSSINIATLYHPEEKKYLGEKIEIAHVSGLASLAEKKLLVGNKIAELFGNPDFSYDFRIKKPIPKKEDSKLIAKRFGLADLEELPGTEKEVNEIRSILENNGWNTKVFKKEEASEENLRNTDSPQILHIATHGYFLNRIEIGDEKFMGFNSGVFTEVDDLKSGLILAGASVSTQDSVKVSAKNDGILTSAEASQLNLTNTELVVLSACQTGLGFDLGNQGISGLQQALSCAGAKNLLMSLWPVDDDATQLLMVSFYRNFIKGHPGDVVKAFRNAQLEVKKTYPHPYYWGAFILMSN